MKQKRITTTDDARERACLERPTRPSFREAFRRAAEQVEMQCCGENEQDQMRELCYIIAEVYIIHQDSKIAIANELLDAYLVQEIFGELGFHHLQMVMQNFNAKTELVRNKRAYLRTALYNAVFEYEAHYKNLAAHTLAGGAP